MNIKKKWIISSCVTMGVVIFVMIGIYLNIKRKSQIDVSIIGGADGPTSIFLATKGTKNILQYLCISLIGIVLLIGSAILLRHRKKNEK